MCHLDEFQNIFLTPSRSHCILSRPTFNTEKKSFVVLLVSMRNILCFRTLHSTYGFDMTKFSQCQFETCFKNICFSKRHTMPISNMFHRHMFQNGTQHVHSQLNKSTKYRRYHSAHQGSGRIQTKQPNPTTFRTPPNHQHT